MSIAQCVRTLRHSFRNFEDQSYSNCTQVPASVSRRPACWWESKWRSRSTAGLWWSPRKWCSAWCRGKGRQCSGPSAGRHRLGREGRGRGMGTKGVLTSRSVLCESSLCTNPLTGTQCQREGEEMWIPVSSDVCHTFAPTQIPFFTITLWVAVTSHNL